MADVGVLVRVQFLMRLLFFGYAPPDILESRL